MFDEPVRARFSRLAAPLVSPVARLGVTPGQVTMGAFLMAAGAAALIAAGHPRIGLAVWLVSRIGDGLDGELARHTGGASGFGGYLDITLDMAGYTAMVMGFAVAHPTLSLAWSAVLAGYVLAITTTLALSDAGRSAGRQVNDTNRTFQFTPALTEAGETTAMYALWVLFPTQLPWLVWVWAAALAATVLQRTYLAARLLR